MRYSRGYFAISDTSDVPALLHVRNARAIQFEQLWEFLSHDGVKTTAASLRWRVARLEKAGLITRSNEYRHLGKPVFTITHVGLDLLESRGHYLVALPSNVEQILHPSQISHALELVRIRLALLRAGLLVSWKGELEVASRNLILETEVSKDYDAIAEIALAGGSVRVAIEYERSAKAAARYRAIRDSLEKDDSVGVLLYLVANDDLLYLLAVEMRGIRKQIAFALCDSFHQSLLDTRALTNSKDSDVTALRDFLAMSSGRSVSSL